MVWFPHTVVVGWALYRYGHWIWISPWGWTWVDDAPWGFAPFHYGRWVVVRGAWGWVPCAPRHTVGVAYVRPVYAPALVAWVGGPHFAVGVGIGGGGGMRVGWFPLGPHEVFVPSYRVSRTYVNNVNISNTTVNTTIVNNYYNTTVVNKNVTNIRYVNQGVPGAVTATTSQIFTSAQPVARNFLKIDKREMAGAQVAVTAPTIVPERKAVLGAGTPATARPPESVQNRSVIAKSVPPPHIAPFERQQRAIRDNGGRPLGTTEARKLQPQTAQEHPDIRIAPPAQQVRAPNMPVNKPGNLQNIPGSTQNKAGSRPGVPATNAGRPPINPGSQPGNAPTQRPYDDRPPAARPGYTNHAAPVNPQLDQMHRQQAEQLRAKQDQERQKIELQQQGERDKLEQKKADDQRRQKVEQKHQQQLEQLERKQAQEQQRQLQKQQQQQKQQKKQTAKQACEGEGSKASQSQLTVS